MAQELTEIQLIELELKRNELELQREQIAQIKQKKQEAVRKLESKNESFKQYKSDIEGSQRNCNHMKGGMNGGPGVNSSSYALIHNRYPDGRVGVICQRCQKQWFPGDPDYDKAVNLPTSNTMSQSSTWSGITEFADLHQFKDGARS